MNMHRLSTAAPDPAAPRRRFAPPPDRLAAVFCCLLLSAGAAQASDLSWSGFGTLGYARSNLDLNYERFIDKSGTFKRDSLFGLQLNAEFTPQWSATAQAVLAPALDDDHRWETSLQWAFVSWRPNNDWQLRAGKMRMPLYLNSENLNVGATFDFARLPNEMYSLTPTNDFVGASLNRNWSVDAGELSLDAYAGKARPTVRTYLGTPVPSVPVPGVRFLEVESRLAGLILSFRSQDNVLRAGLHRTSTQRRDQQRWIVSYPFVTLPSGLGYYQTDPAVPGPGVETLKDFNMSIATLGADIGLGNDLRLVGEYARRSTERLQNGYAGNGAYLSLLKKSGAWTSYVTYGVLRSEPAVRQLFRALEAVNLPASVPGAAMLNAAQRIGAEFLIINDQSSWTLGTGFALTPTSKVKAEWRRMQIGDTSRMVDIPAGVSVRDQRFNILSLSYSFVF